MFALLEGLQSVFQRSRERGSGVSASNSLLRSSASQAIMDRGNLAKQIRVLHAVGVMNRAGAEMLVMNVLRSPLVERFQFDVLVRERAPGWFDQEVRDLGGHII